MRVTINHITFYTKLSIKWFKHVPAAHTNIHNNVVPMPVTSFARGRSKHKRF